MRTDPVVDCWNRVGVWGDGTCPELTGLAHCRNCAVYSSAAAQMLDRELPARYREEWASHFAREKSAAESGLLSMMLFRVDSEWFALPTSVCREVAEVRAIHSLPHCRNAVVLGLVNIRGELLICVSLGEALGLDGTDAARDGSACAEYQRLLIVDARRGRLAIPVHEVHGIARFAAHDLKPPPATVARAGTACTRGILVWKNRSVGCLDERSLFQTLNGSVA